MRAEKPILIFERDFKLNLRFIYATRKLTMELRFFVFTTHSRLWSPMQGHM